MPTKRTEQSAANARLALHFILGSGKLRPEVFAYFDGIEVQKGAAGFEVLNKHASYRPRRRGSEAGHGERTQRRPHQRNRAQQVSYGSMC